MKDLLATHLNGFKALPTKQADLPKLLIYNSIVKGDYNEPLNTAASWISNKITPPDVLCDNEDDTVERFKCGNIIFARHWISSWRDLGVGSVGRQTGITFLPKGKGRRHAATLGGWLLAIDKESPHKEEAVELVKYLAGYHAQMACFRDYEQMPTIVKVVKDSEKKEEKVASILETLVDNNRNRDEFVIAIRRDWQNNHVPFRKAVREKLCVDRCKKACRPVKCP